MVFMKIKGLMTLEASYEERFAEIDIGGFFHRPSITGFTDSIVAV